MEKRNDAAIPTNRVNDIENRPSSPLIPESLKYILKKEGFYNLFVVV